MSAVRQTRGEVIEGVAFQFCKVATVAFLLGRFTLPVAAALAAGLYLWAFFSGKHDTRCVLRYPLLIAAFWGVISFLAFWNLARPDFFPSILRRLGLPL